MTEFRVIEAKPYHCGQLARRLREDHRRGLMSFGVNPHRELRDIFDASGWRKAWLIDGRLAALAGVTGSVLESTGYIWLAITEEVRQYPRQFIRTVREQLDEIMATRRELITTVILDDAASCRFAAFMGFHVGHAGDGAPAESVPARRRLVRHITQNPDLRMKIGNGYVVAMGYHRDQEAA